MIYIDLPADLNLEDDQGRNVARLADAVTPDAVTPGAVLRGRHLHRRLVKAERHDLPAGTHGFA